MRHGVKLNPLGRKTAHRKALMRNLMRQLIEHKRIVTTLAKAKALRVAVEPLLTKAKTDSTHHRRLAFSLLQDKETIKELFGTVSEKIAERPGGYTRIIKLDQRTGDAADMAMIELVDFNELYNTTTEVGTKKKRTRRGKTNTPKASTTAVENKVEETVENSAEETVTEVENTIEEKIEGATDDIAENTNDENPSEEKGEDLI